MSSNKALKNADYEADVVIIGAGGAGLAAALTAAEKGVKNIILLEKNGIVGGNTALSAGMFAADSITLKKLGVHFKRDYFFKLAMEWAHWKINPRIVRAFIEKSADTIDWLESKGLEFACTGFYPNQFPPTTHFSKGRGMEVVKVLEAECLKKGVRILMSFRAKKLLLDSKGKIEGLIGEKYGEEYTIATSSVVITTGGYGGNTELVKKYSPQYRDNMLCDGLLHQGDGFIMATEAGAGIEGMGFLLMSGPQIGRNVTIDMGVEPNIMQQTLMAVAWEPTTMWVDGFGKRFTDESTGYHHYVSSYTINRLPDNLSYSIIDQAWVDRATTKGMIIGKGRWSMEERISMPGLERELRKQTRGMAILEQVKEDLCNGCGNCVASCLMNVISLDTKARPEYSACRSACPAGVDVRTYMYLFRTGKIEKAVKAMREYLPLPAVTGRVCPHFCESECDRKEVDEAVNINSIERFIADYSLNEKTKPVPRKYDKKVAVIGSGPAGLSAAYFLTRMGYPVTIFEQQDSLGGMLRMGIPEYRLPRKVLDAQIKYIEDMGVAFKIGVSIGRDKTIDDLKKEFQAVFFATGNQLSRKIEFEGSANNGVAWGLDFLKEVNLKGKVKVGGKIVVIGGGNVAIDVALTALRLGAKEVQVACLEKGNEIPAYKEELEQAKFEGVKINEGWGPKKVLGSGNVTGIELVKCTSVFDSNGKFNPAYDNSSTMTLDADMVILAVGQSPDLSLIPSGFGKNGNAVKVDSITLETGVSGVFAGGDIVDPAGSVVQAISSGSRAATSIDLYLRGEDIRRGRDVEPAKVQKAPKDGVTKVSRNATPVRDTAAVPGSFAEIKPGFDRRTAKNEAYRCMTCGSTAVISGAADCRVCRNCEMVCPQKSLYLAPVKKIEPHIKIADTWDEIAEWIGCDPTVLKESVEQYNRNCDQGNDELFAKDRVHLMPLRKPPFYVMRCNTDYLDTIGGIKINEKMEVIRTDYSPIQGLFAAGVATGGWQADCYNDEMAGAASGYAINSGRIAGESVSEFLDK
jgi:NADPH-dependent glutamate synthase beta subunit-like oxidoreductase/succinate dehydrogenase/fumarate reductase flavoprotein subunit